MSDAATIASYDKYAHAYDEEVIEFWQQFPKIFLEKFADLLPGKRVLNVGSGSGRDALLLRDLGLDVVCVDASKSMIAITTELGFESHLADFTQLQFPAASFDGIWAYTSLIHTPKEEAREVIRRLRALLKPGGGFAFGAIAGDTAGMVERSSMPGASRYFKLYQPQEARELIEPLGFSLVYEKDYQPSRKIYLNQLYKSI